MINLNIYLSDFKMCFIAELGKMFKKLFTTGIVLHVYMAVLLCRLSGIDNWIAKILDILIILLFTLLLFHT